ncbi:MAG: hypothetical protein L0H31_07660 [Nocardioidaceae bacterium]|nr:hypothetical protein [Nocardioidaceae bacterium]
MASKELTYEEMEQAREILEQRASSNVRVWSWLWKKRLAAFNADADAKAITGDSQVYSHGRPLIGGGQCLSDTRLPEIQGTTKQVQGLWPWSVGGGSPQLGGPIGQHYLHGRPFYFDALDWFRANLMSAPTQIVLGLNGYGKSSLVRRMATYAISRGRRVIFMSDCKPDYRSLTYKFDGQVISAGYGRSTINLLDPGSLGEALDQIAHLPEQHAILSEEIKRRTLLNLTIVIELLRRESVRDYESSLLSSALDVLAGQDRHEPPIIADLLEVVEAGGDALRDAISVASEDDYLAETRAVRRSLKAIIDGPMGSLFNGQTTDPINLDSPCIDIDVSAVPENNAVLRAAVMLISWQNAFAAIEGHHVLSDNGIHEKVVFDLIGDELWQLLEASPEHAVSYIDRVTRTNRTTGVVLTLITHSVRDFKRVAGGDSNQGRATGFIERCRAKFIGPVTQNEIEEMRGIINFTETEEALLQEWSETPLPGEEFVAGDQQNLSGLGCFILKTSESDSAPGIPFRVHLPEFELKTKIHSTSLRLEK